MLVLSLGLALRTKNVGLGLRTSGLGRLAIKALTLRPRPSKTQCY